MRLQNIQISEKLIDTTVLQDLVLNFKDISSIFIFINPAVISSENLILISL